MVYRILANIVVLIHLILVLFMIHGFFFTIFALFKKELLDKWLLRTTHLIGISCVVIINILDKSCPLTIWENILRAKYDPSATYPGSFIASYLVKILYPDVHPLIINIPTIFIGMFTLLVYILKPPYKIKSFITNTLERNGKISAM